jgi:flagellin
MPQPINTNIATYEAQRHFAVATAGVQRNFERLSSGFRINSAADDAAGLAVSENLASQIRAYSVAERNIGNAVSMSQTAESGLSQIGDILIRMREIGVQAANGDLTSNARSDLDTEFQLLKAEIDRLAQATKFNGKDMLAGTQTTFDFQVGIGSTSSDIISVMFGGVSLSNFGISASTVAGTDRTAALSSLDQLDIAIELVSSRRASLGSAQNRLTVSQSNSQTVRTNLSASTSRIRDLDVAEETAQLARNQVLMQAGTSVLAQANTLPRMALSLLGGAQ